MEFLKTISFTFFSSEGQSRNRMSVRTASKVVFAFWSSSWNSELLTFLSKSPIHASYFPPPHVSWRWQNGRLPSLSQSCPSLVLQEVACPCYPTGEWACTKPINEGVMSVRLERSASPAYNADLCSASRKVFIPLREHQSFTFHSSLLEFN
jgi:hypothetical protein